MRKQNSNTEEAFFVLLRAGLWEKEARLLTYEPVDFSDIQSLAEEQSVVGLIAAGLEHVVDKKPAKQEVLQFVGQALQLEQQNSAMNYFINALVDKMRKQGIYTILVKGQGIAQCYDRPLWRSCGDVDFFLSEENYKKAKEYLIPLAASVEDEHVREKHLGMTIDPWVVEIHGSLYCGLSSRIERTLDKVYQDTFCGGNVRSWDNSGVQVFQLGVENDAFYVFTHILQHFYQGGIGIRQICDWCRLLWTYRDALDKKKLEVLIISAGLMTEWKAFGALAVESLGMDSSALPFYSCETRWKRKAKHIKGFVIMSGNFGHNRDRSYFEKYPYLIRKVYSLGRRIADLIRHARIFPWQSIRFFPFIMINGIRSAIRGE